jgi:hypothetical protein
MSEIHLYDIGTVFRITVTENDVPLDVSGAIEKYVLLRKPNGESVAKLADFTSDGTDGNIEYAAESNLLDTVGTWKIQGRIIMPNGIWSTSSSTFKVVANVD